MRINTNISSLNAWRNLSSTDGAMSKNLERLSSGFRINRAADDVAGLAISENMRAQITGLNQAVKNAQDGNSLLQTAEGSLNEVHTMLQRMRELAVQSANGTLQPEDRKQIQTEMDNLSKEVTRITNATQFNSKDLLDGSLQASGIEGVTLQIGPNGGQTVSFEIGAMDAKSLGISRDVMIGLVDNGTAAGTGASAAASNAYLDTTKTTVSSVGAGITAGTLQVRYDAGDNTLQLFDSAGTTAIGQRVAFQANSAIEIGDTNTAQTIVVNTSTLGATPATGMDVVRIASGVGKVNKDDTTVDFLADTDAVTNVGYGLQSDSYTVKWDFTNKTLQLFDKAGTTAIGSAVTKDVTGAAIAAGATVSIGDAVTGRTVQIKVKAVSATANLSAKIDVVNDMQSAEAAQFNGKAKTMSSRAYAGLNVSSVTGAQAAIAAIDTAIGKVSYQRSQLGAIQNRLDHTINNLQVVSENLTASESRIRDVDMALEMTQFTKHQILMQSGTAMLAQANQKNQAVLSLLR
jgi:flagellin